MAIRYYAEDISKVPYKLLRGALAKQLGIVAGPVAFAFRLAGRFGLRLPPNCGVGFPGTDVEVDPSELPAAAVAKWAPLLEQLADLGFEPLRVRKSRVVGMKLQYAATLYQPRHGCVAILEWMRMQGAEGLEENTPLEFDSYCERGPDVMTGMVRREDVPLGAMFQLADVEIENHDNRGPLAERLARHRERCRGRDVIPLHADNVGPLIDDRANRRFGALMESGLLRELSEQEVERLRSIDTTGLLAE
ncbi:hypothetical protein Pla123a_10030 [Posidoniimonas polymericola]|uniref:Uncharacterized protein n=1 Tax=Posidoniimonas polymericola TaxID=2528002 RepID=A0A5C5YU73_9BACT|nr:hypothetical protein [Posidoniimonas polymericola]TWT78213.1 hypothetical protein Pla123a_10030 [Posidoniimonas polymericola]